NVLTRTLPPADAPAERQQAAIEELARDLDMRLTLRDASGAVLGHAGDTLPAPGPEALARGPIHSRHADLFVLRLPDGRSLSTARGAHEPIGLLICIAAFAAAIALGAYPVVRRITRRLETLRAQVEALGSGNLAARVEVRGHDEIASLAGSFNRAAERIEKLVAAQRGALASASHELRSPLARIRVAIELLGGAEGDELRARVARDVAELDALIGELLLASRLDALEPGQALERRESVDLLGLAAEEAARTGAECSGQPVTIAGDPALLRRLIRNLLENARRHASGSAVELEIASHSPGRVRVSVADRGPGVDERERERIFEPFYRPAGASESKDGSFGLGLALVRQIARHHGGDARCLAREGGGTLFEVELGAAE
ncbi:MAG TPA: HAMP domain-containing sensor histidine kinase, partial [Myxococcota bacterium]|nr:HAMP domain-containing sensor histidine kinase [Myxococcota bacterium]